MEDLEKILIEALDIQILIEALDIQKEQDFYESVMKYIKRETGINKNRRDKTDSELSRVAMEYSTYKGEIDIYEQANHFDEADLLANTGNIIGDNIRALEKASIEPYFGKVIVRFDDGSIDTLRFGRKDIDDDNQLPAIISWDAASSSLFYKPIVGKASYKSDSGIINCEVLGIFDVTIENGQVKAIIPKVTNKALQKVLSKNASDYMSDIISTIQPDQYDVITEDKINIILQGTAGSGKSSIILHRLVYLLRYAKLHANNMLIFSPSNYFSSYISRVIPRLSDCSVQSETFYDYFKGHITGVDDIETLKSFLNNYYVGKRNGEQNLEDEFKFSIKFKEALDKFVERFFKTRSFKYADKDGNDVDFSVYGNYYDCDFLDRKASSEETLEGKVEVVADFIHGDLRRKYGPRVEIKDNFIRKAVKSRLLKGKPSMYNHYKEFLSSPEFVEAFGKEGTPPNKKMFSYPDFIGCLYLNFEINGYEDIGSEYSHIAIDECQDYSPLQMVILRKFFRNATIDSYGDRMQNINLLYSYRSLEDIAKYMSTKFKYLELFNTYRSTPEIINYVKEFFGLSSLNPAREETGNEVEKREGDFESFVSSLPSDIAQLKDKGAKKICIITKTSSDAKKIYDILSKSMLDLRLLSETSEPSIGSAVFVSSVCETKGLEFDAVISYGDKDNNYSSKENLLYYIACTRALHNLIIYNEPPHNKTEAIQEVPQSKELSLSYLMDYVSYESSPYIQDFLNYVNSQHTEEIAVTPRDFRGMVAKYGTSLGDLTPKFQNRIDVNTEWRKRVLIEKMEILRKLIAKINYRGSKVNPVELFASIPFYDSESAKEIFDDLKLVAGNNFIDNMTLLVSHYFPEDLAETFRKKVLGQFNVNQDGNLSVITESDFIASDNGMNLDENQKREIVEYMKKRRIPFFADAFAAVANKCLTTGLEKDPKAKELR